MATNERKVGVLAVMDAACCVLAIDKLADPQKQLEQARADVAELLAAGKVMRRGRHISRMEDSPDGEACGLCGHNWRDTARHFIVGESAATDLARFDAALERCNGGAQ